MHRLVALSLALLLVVAGCTGTPSGNGAPTDAPTTDGITTDGTPTDAPTTGPTDESPTTEPERSPTEGIDLRTTNCSDAIRWVSFYNLAAAGEYDLWTKRQAAVGYTLEGNASVFLVVYSDGKRLGAEHVSTVDYETGFHADGHTIQFDDPLDERRSIQVVAHRDVDRDGTFDPDTDLACEDENGLVSTEVVVVDFDELTTETPGTSTGA